MNKNKSKKRPYTKHLYAATNWTFLRSVSFKASRATLREMRSNKTNEKVNNFRLYSRKFGDLLALFRYQNFENFYKNVFGSLRNKKILFSFFFRRNLQIYFEYVRLLEFVMLGLPLACEKPCP